MRDFERSGARLRALSVEARIAYSVFLLFTLAAFGVTLLLAGDIVGWSAERTSDYYAGRPSPHLGRGGLTSGGGLTSEGAGSTSDGPVLDIPDEALAPSAPEPMPIRKLLEVSHFHLFSIPVYLLILSHLFMLSSFPPRARRAVIVLAALASAVHIAAPWIARADWPGARACFGVSGATMTIAYLSMMVVPLWDMWRPQRRAASPPAAKGD